METAQNRFIEIDDMKHWQLKVDFRSLQRRTAGITKAPQLAWLLPQF